jgi:glycosyltransferase involved in cell wall biosynthesis
MRIVVDVTPLSLPRTGIGNYLLGMLAGLAEAAGADDEVIAFAATGLRGRRHVQASLHGLPLERQILAVPPARAWRAAWNRLGWPSVERVAGSFDVFHFSDWMYPAQRNGLRATTVHDLFPLHFPKLVHPRTLRMHRAKYKNATTTCDLIFANSEFTADDVAGRLAFPRERIHVAYPGIDPRFSPIGPATDLGASYVLTVSTIEPRKNLEKLIAAFDRLRRDRPALQLAVVGAVGPGATPPPPAEGVRVLGFVPNERLATLYRGAAAFVYPSRFEGFGLPVIEALASGTATVASAHPSLNEASGVAAFRADPNDAEAIAEAIEYALEHGAERLQAGLDHAARFTRHASGAAVLRGYESAL